MGCGASEFIVKEGVPGQNNEAKNVLKQLQLRKEHINALYTAFIDIDANNSGYIRGDEFADYFAIGNNPVNEKIFGIFPSYDYGKINFMEYCCMIWNFLSKPKGLLSEYIFSLYCDTKTLTLDVSQFQLLVEEIHGRHKKIKSNDIHHVVDMILKDMTKSDPNHPKKLKLDDFCNHVREHPTIIGPIIHTRFHLSKTVLGEHFWDEIIKQRLSMPEMNDNNFVLKITGNVVSEKRVMEDAIARRVGPKRRRSIVDTLKDKVKGMGREKIVIVPVCEREEEKEYDNHPTLIAPDRKRKRKSIFKPNIVVIKQQRDGTYDVS